MTATILKAPWRDRTGRISALKAVTFAALFLPAAVAAFELGSGAFAAEPAKQVARALGLWTFRLILIALAVTPMMQIFRLPRLLIVRRTIGVAAFVYAAAHFSAYIVLQNFDLQKAASEIVLRFYLAIGFTTFTILSALAATSTDAMVRRMGAERWRLLHRAVYVAGTLALVHYFIQSKLVVTEPTVFAGLFVWLMFYRVLVWVAGQRIAARPLVLAGLGLASAALTMTGEALGFSLFTPIDGMKVFAANFTFIAGPRPGWYVLMFGAAVTIAALVRGRFVPIQQHVTAAA